MVRALLRIVAALVFLLVARSAGAQAKVPEETTTPRRLVGAFLAAADLKDWDRASALMGSSSAGAGARSSQAAERAKQLAYLLERRSWIHLDAISDEPNGSNTDGELVERVGLVRFEGGEFPILLERTRAAPPRWSFASETLARVAVVYAERGPTLVESLVPISLRTSTLGLETWQWIGLPVAILLAFVIGRIASFLLLRIGRAVTRRTAAQWDDELIEVIHGPARVVCGCIAYAILSYSLALPSFVRALTFHVVVTLGIGALVWTARSSVDVIANFFERRALRERPDQVDWELHARGARTRVQMLRRVASVVILVLGVALVLTQFEVVRSVGISLLASAGVAGVVLGLAAQRTIGGVLAGIQISVTQPIRIGDTVVVENETGTIEEITLTYAILKVWDERRLVVPITRFLEQPFQNHTKVPSGQHGSVMLYASWTLPMDALRKELDRIVAAHAKWDGRTKSVSVTDTREQAIEVRVLVSTAAPGDLFDLRAHVRERLVAWLQAFEGGEHLPRVLGTTAVHGSTVTSTPQ